MKVSTARIDGLHVPAEPPPRLPGPGGRLQRSTSANAGLERAARTGRDPADRPGEIRRWASLPSRPAPPAAPAPALHQLIGLEHAQALDAAFGSLQPVRTKEGDCIHEWERDAAGKPLTHPRRIAVPDTQGRIPDLTRADFKALIDLEALKGNDKQYIWAASALGRVFVGEAEPACNDPRTGATRHRGHPLLVGGGLARICGEINHDPATGDFVASNKSGRYSRYEDRTESHLDNVAGLLSQAFRQPLKTLYLNKAAEPLVLPSLDPDFERSRDAGT